MEKSSKISENIVYIILSMGEGSSMDSPEKILCTRRENRAGGFMPSASEFRCLDSPGLQPLKRQKERKYDR